MEYHDILLDVNGLERNWRYDQGMDYRRTVPRPSQPTQRGGFTLVELSIVLVIIGLLIGGILAGRSMIETAMINSQIRQIQQLDVATQNFVMNYGFFPGDTNRDGILQFSNMSNENCAWPQSAWVTGGPATRECWTVFSDLALMSGLPGNYSSNIYSTHTTQTMFGPGRYGPLAANGKSGVLAGQTANLQYFFWIINSYKNCISGPGGWSFNGECDTKAFTPSQAYSIETKIDDGNAYSGSVAIVRAETNSGRYITHYEKSCCGSTFNESIIGNAADYAISFRQGDWTTCINRTTGAYTVSSTVDTCGLQFRSTAVR